MADAVGEGRCDSGETSKETIFMPRLVLVLAGMKSVVRLLGAGIAIR